VFASEWGDDRDEDGEERERVSFGDGIVGVNQTLGLVRRAPKSDEKKICILNPTKK
jgi:hypothetical protein